MRSSVNDQRVVALRIETAGCIFLNEDCTIACHNAVGAENFPVVITIFTNTGIVVMDQDKERKLTGCDDCQIPSHTQQCLRSQ